MMGRGMAAGGGITGNAGCPGKQEYFPAIPPRPPGGSCDRFVTAGYLAEGPPSTIQCLVFHRKKLSALRGGRIKRESGRNGCRPLSRFLLVNSSCPRPIPSFLRPDANRRGQRRDRHPSMEYRTPAPPPEIKTCFQPGRGITPALTRGTGAPRRKPSRRAAE